MLDLVPIHANFVASNDGLEAIVLAETLSDVGTKLHADTTLAGPAALLFLRVSPEHLHHEAGLAWLLLLVSVEFADVIEGDLVVGEQAAVKNQVLATDKGSQGQG